MRLYILKIRLKKTWKEYELVLQAKKEKAPEKQFA